MLSDGSFEPHGSAVTANESDATDDSCFGGKGLVARARRMSSLSQCWGG